MNHVSGQQSLCYLFSANLLSLDHGAIVGDAHFTGDLPACSIRMHFGHFPLFQPTLLDGPFLAVLVQLMRNDGLNGSTWTLIMTYSQATGVVGIARGGVVIVVVVGLSLSPGVVVGVVLRVGFGGVFISIGSGLSRGVGVEIGGKGHCNGG